ncbi:MAG: HEAT repeat domain-containing protein [Simkaniaceae bacterium]|nr:HEAT repeat domain-containing protein [Simkaniaceae bacterium]
MRFLTLGLALFSLSQIFAQADGRQALFLFVQGDIDSGINAYIEAAKREGHNLDVLQEMATHLIENGAKSYDLEEQLISMYGIGVSGLARAKQILWEGVTSEHPQVVLASLQLLSESGDDMVEDALCKAMTSPYLPVRVEALFHLSRRKSRYALPHVESLRGRLPDELSVFFPDFYGLIGTPEAMRVFQKLFEDKLTVVRVAAILSAAKFGRDDFLPGIKRALTHPSPAEQEAAAAALGMLKDLSAVERLEKLAKSPYDEVKLAACTALREMGRHAYDDTIAELAKKGNTFAIMQSLVLPDCENLLKPLLKHTNRQVRLNAALGLLMKRDPSSLDTLCDLIFDDVNEWGFYPTSSGGHSLYAWKVAPSASKLPLFAQTDIVALSLAFQERMLAMAVDLPKENFLNLARRIFATRHLALVPLTVRLLENCECPEVISLLRWGSQMPGAPLIRGYCALALYRLGKEIVEKERFLAWIREQKGHELFRFRPMVSRSPEVKDLSVFELTPEENSRLLIESYETLAMKKEEHSIEILLDAIKSGNPKNRPALAGLLLRAID